MNGPALPARTTRIAIAAAAMAIMLTEVAFTRLASAALFYHYAFLAVSVAMAGLCLGSLHAQLRPAAGPADLRARLAATAGWGAAALLAWMLLVALQRPAYDSLLDPLAFALGALPAMTAMGALVARLLVHAGDDRPGVYAADLAFSALGALLTIPLLGILEGPGVLVAPALLLALAGLLVADGGRRRAALGALAAGCAAVAVAEAARPGPLLPPHTSPQEWATVSWERWNAHSRIRVATRAGQRTPELVIDRSASSLIAPIGSVDDVRRGEWDSYVPLGSALAYRLGERPAGRVGIIGVGGGPDIVQALQAGAERVDGFELNGLILGLLRGEGGFTRLGTLAPVTLRHDEARHALAHAGERYDVLRMTLTDTWAATAQGGFVLSEAALYTREAWRLFLDRLTPTGRLAVTRWLLPAAPAEAERTVALAAGALRDRGLDPARHLIAIGHPRGEGAELGLITVLVSPTAFTDAERDALAAEAAEASCELLLAPGMPPAPLAAGWAAHFTEAGHAARVAASAADVSVPTDLRPFFFLQKRVRDIDLFSVATDPVSLIVQSGVRGLVAGFVLSALLAGAILALAVGVAGRTGGLSARRLAGALGLGFGYMCVQLGLHQRFSLVLGHPTVVLAFVVAAFILGSGIGSVVLGRASVRPALRGGALVASLALAGVLLASAGAFAALPAGAGRLAAGAAMVLVGFGLGGQLPALLRGAERRGETVAALWTANGAASVAGAGSAAMLALAGGSVAVLGAGVACYGLVLALGVTGGGRR